MATRIGIVGGGQLGRMLTLAAHPLGLAVTVLDPTPGCPAAQVGAAQVVGGIREPAAIRRLAAAVDVVTWEVEHIDAGTLEALEREGHLVRPSPVMLATVRDKLAQKQLFAAAGVPVPAAEPFPAEPTPAAVEELFGALGRPVVVKARMGGFDGRGNAVFDGDLDGLARALGDDWAALYAEEVVAFDAELAVVAARGAGGEVAAYPTIRTTQRDGICHSATVPAGVGAGLEAAAQRVAAQVLDVLGGAGVFAVEMFAVRDRVLVNEVAPRVHNSGHLTIEAFATSQFEQHLRAVAGLPLGATTPRAPAAAMVNVLGRPDGGGPAGGDGSAGERAAGGGAGVAAALGRPDVHLHLYGKEPRPGRKVGHVTALGDDPDETLARAGAARAALPL
ncbi:MAG TPA: 5-(carboxyamino)imidazole ribonucleotide synthase [Acidimicrobiales bacterium]|nr:5-(carboxyamino)imidazole ribonucleotide synthase [Acidimicrobiales bacterium]